MNGFQRIETATKSAVILRNYQRARGRALTRLAKAHPEEYTAYLKEEQLNDQIQGKAWINIYGDTGTHMDTHTTDADNNSNSQATYTEDEGDL